MTDLNVQIQLECIEQIMAKAGPDALPPLSGAAADFKLPPNVRYLAWIEMVNLMQCDGLKRLPAREQLLIEELRSGDYSIAKAAQARAASSGSEQILPYLLELFVEDLEGPQIKLRTKDNFAGYKAMRAIIERRKESVVPVLVDCCLHALDGGFRGQAASLLREMGDCARSAIPLLESARQNGDGCRSRRAAEALEKIRKESK